MKKGSKSVIDSVISGEYKSQISSDFSIIFKEGEEPLEGIAKIETKQDIYAEDVVMCKIIYYVSMFSKEIVSSLSRLRSKEAISSIEEKKKGDFIKVNNQDGKEEEIFLDLDDVDEDFLNILLDSLEQFELYKLCLIVCNRYKLKERVGRYLVSIGHKYSSNQIED